MVLNYDCLQGLPCSSDGKESACNAGDLCSVPGSGRSSGEGSGNPLQCSCLENPMDRRAWQVTVWGCKESDTTEELTLQYNIRLSHNAFSKSMRLTPICRYTESEALGKVIGFCCCSLVFDSDIQGS